jgi:hypothetical protein
MGRPLRRLLLPAACAAALLFGLAAAPALATHFEPETYGQLLSQLHRREVVALVLHPQGYKAHASATGGRHFTVAYTPAEQPLLAAAARAGGATFTVDVSKPKSTVVHHKLRYIAGGILIVVIVVVLVVLLVGRRRELEGEDSPPQSQE